MFTQQIGKMIEVYLNDMLIKSLYVVDHLTYLIEFNVLYAYNMKLNSKKCVFGVS